VAIPKEGREIRTLVHKDTVEERSLISSGPLGGVPNAGWDYP